MCSITVSLLLLLSINVYISASQSCLSSPPPLPWTNNNGIYYGTLTYGPKNFQINVDGVSVDITTRLHNQMFPSPTIRFIPGKTYKLTLENDLDAEAEESTLNIIKEVNYTNIHTHGLHISGESPADNIFNKIDPKTSYQYTYHIPCDHSGGTHWYHPHHHGSTTIQAGGGSSGALIVEDNINIETNSFPDWYKQLGELIMVVQYVDLGKIASVGNGVDLLFKADPEIAFYTINGQHKPTICINKNEYTKFRILHVNIASGVTLAIPETSCHVYLLAKDGILVDPAPRHIPMRQMPLSVASRADVAVTCGSQGIFELTGQTTGTPFVIGYIHVTDTGIASPIILSTFNPFRPSYLQSLLNEAHIDNIRSMKMSARTINGQKFSGSSNYQFTISSGSINEWNINGAGAHPFHVHVNHFQIISGGDGGNYNEQGWVKPGDWIDTLNTNAVVRFKADRFGGKVILHCHILEHEDQGAMGVFLIDGGCDAGKNHFGSVGSPQCVWDICSANPAPTTASPTTASPTTASPTTTSPTAANPTTASPTAVSSPTTASPTTASSPTDPPCGGHNVACVENSECCSNNCNTGPGRCTKP
eukprot:271137_1